MESVHAEDHAGPSDVGSEPCEESPAPPAKKARVKKVSLEELLASNLNSSQQALGNLR